MNQRTEIPQAVHAEDQVRLEAMIAAIETLFVGKRGAIELTLIALLAEGHVLFEDIPGVGKTTLARAVARSLGCQFKRIQFTSDLLPSDIVGVSVYDRERGQFQYKPGPVITNLLLADEINRTTPRTQSALLEAMNEHQVTVDDTTHMLPRPFMVLATQNPREYAGTYPLPESQLDRFLLRVVIGYPAPEVEQTIIRSLGFRDSAQEVVPVMDGADVAAIQERVTHVHAAQTVVDYMQALVEATRRSPYLEIGVSIRGAISLYRASQARAYLNGRDHVLPDDPKALWLAVCSHRVMMKKVHDDPLERRHEAENVLQEILAGTAVPL